MGTARWLPTIHYPWLNTFLMLRNMTCNTWSRCCDVFDLWYVCDASGPFAPPLFYSRVWPPLHLPWNPWRMASILETDCFWLHCIGATWQCKYRCISNTLLNIPGSTSKFRCIILLRLHLSYIIVGEQLAWPGSSSSWCPCCQYDLQGGDRIRTCQPPWDTGFFKRVSPSMS